MAYRFSDAWLDELRSRVGIADVVSEYVALKPKGRRLWGLCPFHGEKTASFSVDPDAQMYYCFGCHKGGTVIQFVMELERMEFFDAVKLLAERAHMPLPEGGGSAEEDVASRALRERIYEANTAAAHFYHDTLWTGEGAEALTYLYKRGLDDAALKRFGLGSTARGWDTLIRHLEGLGFPFDVVKAAGLATEKDGRRYDMFRSRAMFPIVNPQGRVLGFGGRALGDGTPKYLNTADTPVFNKRQGLYALNYVKKERGLKALILVEGYMDVVSLRLHGVPGVVATLGTALTEEQARLCKRFAPEVRVCYDGDSAGQKAILRALDIFERQGVPARVIDIPDGMDPDEFVRAKGADAFLALRPMPPTEYRLLRAAEGFDLTTQDGRTQYAMRACELLRGVANPVELENYLARLVVQTGFEKDVLTRQIGLQPAASAAQEKPERPKRIKREAPIGESERAERTLLKLYADGLIPSALASESAFLTPLYAKIASEIKSGESRAAILDKLEGDEQEKAARALSDELEITTNGTAAEAAQDCIDKLRMVRLNESINAAQQELKGVTDASRRRELLALTARLAGELDLTRTGRKE